MGKKGFNWRARQPVKTVIDNTKTKQVSFIFMIRIFDCMALSAIFLYGIISERRAVAGSKDLYTAIGQCSP